MKDLALFPFFDNAQGSKDGKSTNKNQVSTVFFSLNNYTKFNRHIITKHYAFFSA